MRFYPEKHPFVPKNGADGTVTCRFCAYAEGALVHQPEEVSADHPDAVIPADQPSPRERAAYRRPGVAEMKPAEAESVALLSVIFTAMLEELEQHQLQTVADRLARMPLARTHNGAAAIALIRGEAKKREDA